MAATKKKELKVSTIAELKEASEPQVVELPPFSKGHPFVAVLKRPSMLDMMKNGRIPNSLIESTNKLFTSGPAAVVNSRAVTNKNSMNELFEIVECLCEDAFVQPTYKEIKDAGIKLTDQQMIFIFRYSQEGVDALNSFRSEQ